jgi:hypothetical protein
MARLLDEQNLPLKSAWGDRGLHSAANEKTLANYEIYSGLCPRDPGELRERLVAEPGLRKGLKRRAGTEARISILIRDFMGRGGDTPKAKGFAHRELLVSWAVLTHNLWVLARLERATPAEELREQIPEAA